MGTRNMRSEGGRDTKKKQVIEDPRFSSLHYDPRFQNVSKHQSKVPIDSRFQGILTNKHFNTNSSTRVDKRGKLKQQSENNLRHYYHFEDKKIQLLSEERGSESASSDSESNEDTDDDDVEVENGPVIEKETHRLAVVNMDWSHVKAVDLFVMLTSFLPKEGQIKSVAVYPSEFGLKRMEEEAVRGPVALFEDDKKNNEVDSDADGDSDEDGDDDDEGSDEVSDNEKDSDDVSDSENEVGDGDEEDTDEVGDNDDDDGEDEDDFDEDEDEDEDDEDTDEIDNENLRAYEKSRLRYYFAVVECDSVATADCLYKACDGLEFERSSNVLDLRFIPDTMEFKHQPRDVATEAPADYEGLDFQTRALQQSNTALSWDEDEPHRAKTLRRLFNEKQLAEMESNDILASDESESDEDDVGDQNPSEKMKTKADRCRALLKSGDGDGDGSEQGDEDQNMEVTFATGLEDISKKIIEKKEKGSETVFEARLRKNKEKKIAKKNKSKMSSDDDSDESDDQEGGEDPDDFFQEEAPSVERKKKGVHGKKKSVEKSVLEKEVVEASSAEHELLLADESENKKAKGYNLKPKKVKGKGKVKKGEETPDETDLPSVDLDDPRFSGLLSNPEFFLDPTDPQFKRSATYRRQLAQRQQMKPEEQKDVEEPMKASERDGNSVGSTRKAERELSATIKSVKMKSQQLSMQLALKNKDKMGSTSGKKHKLQGSDRPSKKSKHHK